jgi:hypothetical protein
MACTTVGRSLCKPLILVLKTEPPAQIPSHLNLFLQAAPQLCIPVLSSPSAGEFLTLMSSCFSCLFFSRNIIESIIATEFQRAGFSGFDSPNTLEVL